MKSYAEISTNTFADIYNAFVNKKSNNEKYEKHFSCNRVSNSINLSVGMNNNQQ